MKTFHLMGPAPYYTNSFVLCSEAGNALAVDPVAAPAYYPVSYTHLELPLTVEFINTPPGFDIASLPYALSRETLEVSGPASIISNLTELSVGYFDLSTFAMDKDYQLNVNLPDGIVSQENLTSRCV